MSKDDPTDAWTDEAFLSYVELHARTELALIHRDHVARLHRLAGTGVTLEDLTSVPTWVAMHSDYADPLIKKARAKAQGGRDHHGSQEEVDEEGHAQEGVAKGQGSAADEARALDRQEDDRGGEDDASDLGEDRSRAVDDLASPADGVGKPPRPRHPRGSRTVRGTDMLPTNGTTELVDEQRWATLGFKLGAPFDDDPLFRSAEFPPGWRVDQSADDTIDPRHLYVYDEQKRCRAYLFYANEAYDRDALVYFKRRYSTRPLAACDPEIAAITSRYGEDPIRDAFCIHDGMLDVVVERIVIAKLADERLHEYGDRLRALARERLIALFPEAYDPLAYW
jgi:hypothetical protein